MSDNLAAMRRLSIAVAFILAALFVPAALAQPAADDTGRRIVLVGARWCAPCQLELRTLPALEAASAPDQLELAWVDRPPSLPDVPDRRARILPLSAARALAEAHGGEGRGLPFAILIARSGRVCAIWRGPLRPADVPSFRQRCDNRQSPSATD